MLTNLDQTAFLEIDALPPGGADELSPEWDDGQASSIAEAVQYCRALADGLSAAEFGIFFRAAKGAAGSLVPVCDTTFPGISPLSRGLSARGVAEAAAPLARQPTPAWWRAPGTPHVLSPAARRWAREVEAPLAGVTGIAFPVAVERGRGGVIVFAGEEMIVDEGALCETHARCHMIFADVARLRMPCLEAAPSVSKRELECLRLTANGLTSDDIAAALGLSVHTANQYLTNSTQKLNAVNRIHAVAKALRCGLID